LYEILVTKEYDEFVAGLGSPRFVIDGGANVGFFSLYFLSRYPESHIVAIEPDPDTVAVCRKNLAPYSDRVTVVQGAIWGQSGKLRLEATGEDWNHKTKAPGEGELGSVEAFTMPSLIARGGGAGVDLLKLDVEGAESEIFVANAKEWLPSVANIVVELHNPECHERFFSAMEPFQYEERGRDSASAPRGPNSPLVYCCRNIRPRVPGSDASAESDRALSRLP
jgi:FkbM family methyltransferase